MSLLPTMKSNWMLDLYKLAVNLRDIEANSLKKALKWDNLDEHGKELMRNNGFRAVNLSEFVIFLRFSHTLFRFRAKNTKLQRKCKFELISR